MQAYRLSNYQLVGGAELDRFERFDIVAKAPEGSRPDQTMLMLRGLLAERFKLKVHGENAGHAGLRPRAGARLTASSGEAVEEHGRLREDPRGAARGARRRAQAERGRLPFTMPGAERESRLQRSCMRPTR
jgi:uncharacterized protein (TIGR03435 family)